MQLNEGATVTPKYRFSPFFVPPCPPPMKSTHGCTFFSLAHYTHQAAKLGKLLGDGRWYLVVLMDIHGNT